jgi:hypothetical protein
MLSPLCSMWPLLAALLFGWLLCGWFARQFLRSPDRFGASSSVSPAWVSFQRVYWTLRRFDRPQDHVAAKHRGCAVAGGGLPEGQ